MKKLLFVSLALLVGAGIVIGYRMAKGEGGWLGSCCGWGGETTDPWATYTPPAEETAAGEGAGTTGEGAGTAGEAEEANESA